VRARRPYVFPSRKPLPHLKEGYFSLHTLVSTGFVGFKTVGLAGGLVAGVTLVAGVALGGGGSLDPAIRHTIMIHMSYCTATMREKNRK
jgi:hypothetical protein